MIAFYVRVSTKTQNNRGQIADLKRWQAAYVQDDAQWYRDEWSGTNMDRPGWARLWADIEGGSISRVVVWRIDRLGRTAKGLTQLFGDLQDRGVSLVSLREGIDLTTPAGRMMATVLASVAQYETEVRSERQRAGIDAARAAGKAWGGRKPGTRIKLTKEKESAIRRLRASGESVSAIARAVELSRPTVYAALRDEH